MLRSSSRFWTWMLTVLLGAAPPSLGQTMSGVTPSNGSTPLDAFEPNGAIIPPLAKFDTLSSVSVTSSSPTTFTTRYISTNSVDSEALQPAWSQTLSSSYQIAFSVTAPGFYELTVDTSLVGDLCLDDDNVLPPAGNWAEIFDVSGSQTGGTVESGSLDLTFVGGSQRLDDTGASFDPITSPFSLAGSATISGSSLGVAQSHTLSFGWTQVSYTPGAGDPSTIRLGQESRLPDVSACTYSVPPRPQAPDGHWVTVSVTSVPGCGDGVVDPGEDCDEGAANGQTGSCCTTGCAFEPPTLVCRSASAGDVCDIEEFCTGSSGACPADSVEPAAAVCRASAGVCDPEETCDGVTKQCPADQKSAGECRAPVGLCDVAEFCDGISDDCPIDGFQSASLVCRPSNGVCDVEENCTGTGPNCPADGFVTGTLCRSSAGECDVAEVCSGSSADCPADGFQPNGTPCTDDGLFCSGAETCQAGTCVSAGDPCGAVPCDEGADICLVGPCPPAPDSGCLTSGKSIVLYKDNSTDSRDKLIYKWVKGQSTTQAALSDPLSTAGYDLCLYAGTAAALIYEASVPPSPTKWKAIGTKGYKYKDRDGTEDGAQRIVLKASSSDKSKALWKGKGGSLPEFLPGALPIAEFPLTVQLHNDQGSVCMESSFDAGDVRRNEADQLKLKD